MATKRHVHPLLKLVSLLAIGLAIAPSAQADKSVVGGLITSEVVLPSGQHEPIGVTWTAGHVYAIGGPIGGVTTSIEYFDPQGGPIAGTTGIIHGEVLLPGGSRDPIRVAWTGSHVYALGGPVGGMTSCVKYRDPGGMPITQTRGVVNSSVLLPDLTTEFIRVAWNDGHIYALAGPVAGATSAVEYLAGGMPIAETRGVITGDVRRPDQRLEPVRYAWTDGHVYALGGPIGGVTTCIECFDPLGSPIPDARGMLDTEVLLPGNVREPIRVVWNPDHIYAILGPLGGVTSSVEYLDGGGLPITGIRGAIRAETQMPDDSFEPITIVWTAGHVYALSGPVAGVTTCIEYPAPWGGGIADLQGAIYTEVLVDDGGTWKWRYVTLAWTPSRLFCLRGPVGGMASTMQYFTPGGGPVAGVRGALNSMVRLPDNSREMVWVVWTDSHIYAYGWPAGGPAPCVEYPAPAGGPILGTRAVVNSDVKLNAWTRETIRIAWNEGHVYALNGPVGGVANSIEYMDGAGGAISAARGVVHAEVRLPDGSFEPVAAVKTDGHIYALSGPVGGITACAEYLDPALNPIPMGGEGIEAFVYLYWPNETGSFAGAGWSDSPTIDAFFVDEAYGAVSATLAVGGGEATVIGGPAHYDGPTLIVDLPGRTLLAPYCMSSLITGSTVMLGEATSGTGINDVGTAEQIGFGVSPNPSAASAVIRYTLPQSSQVEIAIYDIAGRLVRTLEARPQSGGTHTAVWDGTDNQGARAASGVYSTRITADGRQAVGKIVLLR